MSPSHAARGNASALFRSRRRRGAVFVEAVFAWPGLGSLAATAVSSRDYPLLMGTSVLVAGLVIVASLASDLAYALLDPRVRLP